jgi:hypothetical protein
MPLVLFKNLRYELSNHEPLYDDAIKWSRDVISKEKAGPYRGGLEKKYTEVVTLWRELKMKVRSNLREISVIIPLAKKYHSAVKPVRDVTDQVMKSCDVCHDNSSASSTLLIVVVYDYF